MAELNQFIRTVDQYYRECQRLANENVSADEFERLSSETLTPLAEPLRQVIQNMGAEKVYDQILRDVGDRVVQIVAMARHAEGVSRFELYIVSAMTYRLDPHLTHYLVRVGLMEDSLLA